MAYITITGNGSVCMDGNDFPAPKRGATPTVITLVDSARNADGVVVGQRIGRDQYKLDALEWPVLSGSQWARLMQVVSGYFFYVTFTDPVTNSSTTIRMYAGDRTAKPYWLNSDGTVQMYTECKMNLIDTGG